MKITATTIAVAISFIYLFGNMLKYKKKSMKITATTIAVAISFIYLFGNMLKYNFSHDIFKIEWWRCL